MGLARSPNSDREKHEHGHIVYLSGQTDRMIYFDELKISLDGSSDENTVGHQSETPTRDSIKEIGKSTIKSADEVTIMIGAIGEKKFTFFGYFSK